MRYLILFFSMTIFISGQVADSIGKSFSMSGGVGTVIIDGKTYNQLAFRPDIPIWKFGVGFDFAFYFDDEGNLRTDDWGGMNVLTQKIMYLRYGKPNNKLYFRAGLLPDVTLGYGILVNHYTNGLEYPAVKQLGLNGKIRTKFVGVEFFSSNLEDKFWGLRAAIKPISKLEIRVSFVQDGNMYKGVSDSDGDGRPDLYDAFPNQSEYWNDFSGDGIADNNPDNNDLDGDGLIQYDPEYGEFDNNIYDIDDDGDNLEDWKEEPDSIFIYDNTPNIGLKRRSFSAIAFDIGYSIYESGNIGLATYVQIGFFSKFRNEITNKYKYPMGVAPGVRLDSGPVSIFAEYRSFTTQFVSEFFNRTYDIERSTIVGDSIKTKDRKLTASNFPKRQGWMAGATMGLGSFGSFDAILQNMSTGDVTDKSIYSTLKLNVSKVPKLKSAEAFYQQTNVQDWFESQSESAILGYRIGFDVSDSVILFYKFQQTYIDTDGDGELNPVTFTQIETAFTF